MFDRGLVQTHSQACHHAKPPPVIMEAAIIQVLMLNESATQKPGGHGQQEIEVARKLGTRWGASIPTKFQGPHCRRSGSTGFRSRLVSMSCALVRPGSDSVCILSSRRAALLPLKRDMTAADCCWRRRGSSEKIQANARSLKQGSSRAKVAEREETVGRGSKGSRSSESESPGRAAEEEAMLASSMSNVRWTGSVEEDIGRAFMRQASQKQHPKWLSHLVSSHAGRGTSSWRVVVGAVRYRWWKRQAARLGMPSNAEHSGMGVDKRDLSTTRLWDCVVGDSWVGGILSLDSQRLDVKKTWSLGRTQGLTAQAVEQSGKNKES